MSFRGRVIRRQPVACYARPQSLQEQEDQFDYLARVLRKPQSEAQSWPGFYTWSLDMTNKGNFVRVKDIYHGWDGSPTAVAIRFPVEMISVLDIWIQNIGGTAVPTGWRHGYMYRDADKKLYTSFETFSWNGQTINNNTVCRVTVTTSPEYPLASTMIGTGFQVLKGSWTQWQTKPVELYYVHPFFDIEVKTNSVSSEVIMMQPKV